MHVNEREDVHTYMHTHICIHTYHIQTYVRTYMHDMHDLLKFMHICVYTYTHAYVHTYVYTCIHAYVYACIHTCIHVIHTCMNNTYKYAGHAYIHTPNQKIYTHAHTHPITHI